MVGLGFRLSGSGRNAYSFVSEFAEAPGLRRLEAFLKRVSATWTHAALVEPNVYPGRQPRNDRNDASLRVPPVINYWVARRETGNVSKPRKGLVMLHLPPSHRLAWVSVLFLGTCTCRVTPSPILIDHTGWNLGLEKQNMSPRDFATMESIGRLLRRHNCITLINSDGLYFEQTQYYQAAAQYQAGGSATCHLGDTNQEPDIDHLTPTGILRVLYFHEPQKKVPGKCGKPKPLWVWEFGLGRREFRGGRAPRNSKDRKTQNPKPPKLQNARRLQSILEILHDLRKL